MSKYPVFPHCAFILTDVKTGAYYHCLGLIENPDHKFCPKHMEASRLIRESNELRARFAEDIERQR